MTEAQLQQGVIELARLLGWRVAHFRPAQTARGWRTPVEADGKGFPDLVLVRDGRLIFAELKSERGRPSIEQLAWFVAIEKSCAAMCVWSPKEWRAGVIEATLR